MRRRLVLVAIAALASAACSGSGSNNRGAAFVPLQTGDQVPTYSAATLAGDTVRVGGAESPTVLNVWATWCTSCREEMGALDSLQREFRGRGLLVVAVSVDNGSIDRVRRFADANHLGFTVAHDPQERVERSYQLVGVPTTFVIGRDGRLLWSHAGNISDAFEDARAATMRALQE